MVDHQFKFLCYRYFNNILKAKAENETQWIKEISETSGGNIALIKWVPEELKGQGLKNLLN